MRVDGTHYAADSTLPIARAAPPIYFKLKEKFSQLNLVVMPNIRFLIFIFGVFFGVF